jgi:hypothetical protein
LPINELALPGRRAHGLDELHDRGHGRVRPARDRASQPVEEEVLCSLDCGVREGGVCLV